MLKFLFVLQRIFQSERIWRTIICRLSKSKKYHKSFFTFYKKIEHDKSGFPQFALAYCFDKGIYVQENAREAFLWAKESAHKGNSFGINLLGVFYENGYGTVHNPSKACELYLASAKQGNSYGKTSLANYYIEADHPQTNIIVKEFLLPAAKSKNPYALNLLGMLYIQGKYVEQDYKKGFKLCFASAREGNYYGMKSIIYIFDNGLVKLSEGQKRFLKKCRQIVEN